MLSESPKWNLLVSVIERSYNGKFSDPTILHDELAKYELLSSCYGYDNVLSANRFLDGSINLVIIDGLPHGDGYFDTDWFYRSNARLIVNLARKIKRCSMVVECCPDGSNSRIILDSGEGLRKSHEIIEAFYTLNNAYLKNNTVDDNCNKYARRIKADEDKIIESGLIHDFNNKIVTLKNMLEDAHQTGNYFELDKALNAFENKTGAIINNNKLDDALAELDSLIELRKNTVVG